jgi:hypothetical protein
MNRTKIEEKIRLEMEKQHPQWGKYIVDENVRIVSDVLTSLLAEDEGDGWISVEERLPEKMQDILFTVVGVKNMKNEPIPPSIHYGWLDLANGFRSYIDPRDRWFATQWMPLPKAPSQPQKGEGV